MDKHIAVGLSVRAFMFKKEKKQKKTDQNVYIKYWPGCQTIYYIPKTMDHY